MPAKIITPERRLIVPTSQRGWLEIFNEFIANMRIDSKEVQSTDKRGTPLVLWGAQRRFLEEICEGLDRGVRTFYCLKSRQLGISTVSLAIDIFWLAMHPGLQGALVIDSDENREKFRLIIRRYIENFPKGFFGTSFGITKGKDNRAFTHFTNGSTLDYLTAGKRKNSTLGESRAYAFVHVSEVANFGDPDGITSFQKTLAQKNPDRLYIWESTAKGYNHWHDMYFEAKRDEVTKKSFFIGWWAKEINSYAPKGPPPEPELYRQYGTDPPDKDERELIDLVKSRHGVTITKGQLAWYRHETSDTATSESAQHQNTPWVEEQAFVLSGRSFFHTRLINKDMARIQGLNENEEPIYFKGYRFYIGEDFFSSKMEQVNRVEDAELRIWEEPSKHGDYVIGVDPAYGRNDNKDNHCLDEATEILTRGGWKKYPDIKIGDDAVCFDLATEKYSYGRISDVIVKDHDGPMFQFRSKGLDCLATPEHRIVNRWYHLLRTGGKPAWRFKTAEDLASYGRTVAEIPIGGAPMGTGIDGLTLDMCRLLGWVLTDGHVTNPKYVGSGKRKGWRKIRPAIVLAQAELTNKAGLNIASEMRDLVKRLSPGARIRSRPAKNNSSPAVVINFGVRDAEPILKWLEDGSNRIPRRILTHGSPKQLEALFQGILEGDGGWHKGNGTWVKVCPGLDSDFADDIQELATRLGYSATKAAQKAGKKGGPQWLIMLSRRAAHTFEIPNIKKTHYVGKVWCVTVPTGAFVARRNGKMFVTGNCINVFRCYADKLVQVAEYATHDVETRHAAWVLAYLGGTYRNCILNIELTGGPGMAVMTEFKHLKDLIRSEQFSARVKDLDWEDFLNNARWYLYHRPDSMGAGYAYGFMTTRDRKFEIMNQMRDLHATNTLVINSLPLCEEMAIVVQDGSELGASGNGKDDRVFSAALSSRAYIEWVRPKMLTANMTYARVQAGESDTQQGDPTFVDRIVSDYFRRAEERAEAGPEVPKWVRERGLG